MNNTTSIHCLLWPTDISKCDTIILIKRINAVLSLIGCLFIVFVIWLFKFYRSFAYRLLAYLTVATFFDSIIFLVGEPQMNSALCVFEAYWLTYSDWNVVLWITFITTFLYLYSVKQLNTEKYEWVFLAVAFGVPFIIASLPLFGRVYGPAGAWCWVTDTGWRLGIWFVPVLSILVVILIVYILILRDVRRRAKTWSGTFGDSERSELNAHEQEQEVYALLAYPCIFLAVNIFPFVNRTYSAVHDDPSYMLNILSVLSYPMTGWLNCFLFYLNPGVRKRVTPQKILMALRTKPSETTMQEYQPNTEAKSPSFVDPIHGRTNSDGYSQFDNEAINEDESVSRY